MTFLQAFGIYASAALIHRVPCRSVEEMVSGGFPISWIRLGTGGPAEPGVYLRARDVGDEALAELLEDESAWPATETTLVWSS